jgi:hypothetical protein
MDNYAALPTTLTAPARDGLAVTPSDTTDFAILPRAIYVGVTGTIAATLAGGQSVTFQAVPAGSLLPIRMARILATGTTASGIVALW